MAWGDKFDGDDWEDLEFDPIEMDYEDKRTGDHYDYMEDGNWHIYLGNVSDNSSHENEED